MLYSDYLIKPASSRCNIDCDYCFYKDISKNRKIEDYGLMSIDTIEEIVKKAYRETERGVTFGFQGGEPLLSGIDFFKAFFHFIEKYNEHHITTNITVQTNVLLLSEDFAKLFYKHRVLVGISLDGIESIHDKYRYDYQKRGTFIKG